MRTLWRGLRIFYLGLRYRADSIVAEFLPQHLRWFLPAAYLPKPKRSAPERFRLLLEALGPVYIKLGQLLSTRRDLLEPRWADELSKLQSDVATFSSALAQEIIERNLKVPVGDVFASFEAKPIASASLAQVHGAVLPDDSEVVVKVIRPDIEKSIEGDFRLLDLIAATLERFSSDARRLHVRQVVADQRSVMMEEIDLLREANNTIQLRRNFADSDLLYAPRVYLDYCTSEMLVMERIRATPIGEIDELERIGTDMALLATRGVQTFFTQVFTHNFFHADMHPGNIFVDTTNPSNPNYIAIDCATIGQLTEEDQRYLARMIVAFLNRDYADIASLHVESGWVPHDVDVPAFEAVIHDLCDPMFKKPLSELSLGTFLLDLYTAARQFDMEVQPQLVLLQKTLLYIEGLGRQLYPQLDLWTTAKPFMEKWFESRYGLQATFLKTMERLPDLLIQLPDIPDLVRTTQTRLVRLERTSIRNHERLNSVEQVQKQSVLSYLLKIGFGVGLMGFGLFTIYEFDAVWSVLMGLEWQVLVGTIVFFLGAYIVLRR